jgi:spore germination protein YaaH
VPELVALADDLGVDGINVDVEQLDELDRVAYGDFLSSLRRELVLRKPRAQVSVATEAGLRGIGNAATAHASGVDRVFLMGYDYHWGGSNPGAVSPVDRTDGLYDLRWSIDRYVEAGVPRDRILLGLPLYGTRWRTLGTDRTWPVVGSGQAWIPRQHLDVLLAPSFQPSRDPLELSEFFVEPDGKEWLITYYDSPATLRPKLALARDHGLAGAGFWAIGYERGAPGYRELMDDFRDGKVERAEAPPP